MLWNVHIRLPIFLSTNDSRLLLGANRVRALIVCYESLSFSYAARLAINIRDGVASKERYTSSIRYLMFEASLSFLFILADFSAYSYKPSKNKSSHVLNDLIIYCSFNR